MKNFIIAALLMTLSGMALAHPGHGGGRGHGGGHGHGGGWNPGYRSCRASMRVERRSTALIQSARQLKREAQYLRRGNRLLTKSQELMRQARQLKRLSQSYVPCRRLVRKFQDVKFAFRDLKQTVQRRQARRHNFHIQMTFRAVKQSMQSLRQLMQRL
jgi:hypothetical protein